MHFSLSFKDGTEAFSTFGNEPASLVMGDGSLTDGMELSLYGLGAGDEQSLTLSPDQAFGMRDSEKIHGMPREDFGPELELKPGVIVAFDTPSGEELAGTVIDFDDQTVQVDFNHPLAGHEVVFNVEILEVGEPPDSAD
jgi:FKBP-type peptidyl-prolyl cis-trans isomerase SlpA